MVKGEFLEPFLRKYHYLVKLASTQGVELSMLRWESILKFIDLGIGWNLLYRMLLDMFLELNLHFDPSQFDWWDIAFEEQFTQPFMKIEKAKYGASKYNYSIYDPEQVTSQNLERLAWELRYKATEEDAAAWKQAGEALLKHLLIHKDFLLKRDVRESYAQAILDTLALVEGKLLSACYVGFNVVGISKVMPPRRSLTTFKLRNPQDWTSEMTFKTVYVYESHVGFSRVGYARVVSLNMPERNPLKRELSAKLLEEIRAFKQRVGMVQQGPYQVLYQRVFFHQREERLHWTGGEHQLRIQRIKNEVRRLLDEYGVIGNFRAGYIAFALELYYLNYDPHRLWKRWKKVLTEEELIEKYKKMGFDETILKAIKGLIKP